MSAAAAAPLDDAARMAQRERFVLFYQRYARDDDPQDRADKAMEALSKLGVTRTWATLFKKYLNAAEDPDFAEDGFPKGHGIAQIRKRIVAIYEKYEPEKLSKVDMQLDIYSGREEQLIASLVARYGPEPAPPAAAAAATAPAPAVAAAPAPSAAPATAASPESAAAPSVELTRERLTRLYSRLAPEKLVNVEQALSKYAGRFAELEERLRGVYEPQLSSPAEFDEIWYGRTAAAPVPVAAPPPSSVSVSPPPASRPPVAVAVAAAAPVPAAGSGATTTVVNNGFGPAATAAPAAVAPRPIASTVVAAAAAPVSAPAPAAQAPAQVGAMGLTIAQLEDKVRSLTATANELAAENMDLVSQLQQAAAVVALFAKNSGIKVPPRFQGLVASASSAGYETSSNSPRRA